MIGERKLTACLAGVALAGYLVSGAAGDSQPARDSKSAQLYIRLLGTSA